MPSPSILGDSALTLAATNTRPSGRRIEMGKRLLLSAS